MIDLNKYIVTNDPGQAFHTSGYAETANSGRIGSVGGDSFNDRIRIDRSRQSVGSYNRSIIGTSYGTQRAKTTVTGDPTRRSASFRPTSGPTVVAPSPSFHEPMARPHNPYA